MRKNQVIFITPALLQEVQARGVLEVAAEHGWNRTTLSSAYHEYMRKQRRVVPGNTPTGEPLPTPEVKDALKSHRVLCIGDTHIPFEHPKYFDFCRQTYDEFQCNTVVHIGDVMDNHAISYHEHNPDGMSPGDEMAKTKQHLQKWYKEFPTVRICMGNHDELLYRKAITAGLPRGAFQEINQILAAPTGWVWQFGWEIDRVKYQHGMGVTGKLAHLNKAVLNRQSSVIGHVHSYGGVAYTASDKDLIFGLNAGCGIHLSTYAMLYGRDFQVRPTLGCGIILDGKQAFFVPMDLGAKILWR